MTDDGRDPTTGRLRPGHTVAPRDRWHPGKPTQADLVRAKLEPHRDAIVQKVIDLALAGDPKSLALAMAYIAPAARPDAERVTIPGFAEARGMEAKARAVIEAAAAGHCSAEAAQRLLSVLDLYGRAVRGDEIEARLEALEQGRKPIPSADVTDIV